MSSCRVVGRRVVGHHATDSVASEARLEYAVGNMGKTLSVLSCCFGDGVAGFGGIGIGSVEVIGNAIAIEKVGDSGLKPA